MRHTITGKFFGLPFLFIILFFSFAQAQTPSFSFETQEVNAGAVVDIDLKVSSFQDILGMQFSVNWDPSILSFVEVGNFGITDVTEGSFGLNSVADGKVGFLWIDNSTMGLTVDDDTVVFSMKFNAIGAGTSSTELSFGNMPTAIEVSDTTGVVNPTMTSATITIVEPNAIIYNTAPDKIKVKECYPNAFVEKTQLDFELAEGTQLSLSLLDERGRLVHQQQAYYPAGKHQIILNKDLFPSSGVYYYELASSEFKVSQKLIHINR